MMIYRVFGINRDGTIETGVRYFIDIENAITYRHTLSNDKEWVEKYQIYDVINQHIQTEDCRTEGETKYLDFYKENAPERVRTGVPYLGD